MKKFLIRVISLLLVFSLPFFLPPETHILPAFG